MSTTEATTKGSVPRFAFGVVLFVAWALATVVWVASTINLAADGEGMAVVTAVVALALLTLLAGMEGLEVAVIDRWHALYPDRPTSHLAAWLAARQLFVALIVTTATILINRSVITIPLTGVSIDEGILLKVFDIVWTTAHRVVVRSDLPQASCSDQSRPLPPLPASVALPGCRGRAQERRTAAGGVGGLGS